MYYFKRFSIYEALVPSMFDYKHTAGSLKWPLYPRDYSAVVLPASFILLIKMYDCDILFHQLVANTQSYCHTHTLLCLSFRQPSTCATVHVHALPLGLPLFQYS